MEPSAADAYLKGMSGADDITSTQYFQFIAYCRCIFAAGQDGLSQHKSGLVDDADFDILKRSMKIWLSFAGCPAGVEKHFGPFTLSTLPSSWTRRGWPAFPRARRWTRMPSGRSKSPPEKMAPNSAKVRTT